MDTKNHPELTAGNTDPANESERTSKNPVDISEQLRAKVSACSESITSRGNVYGSRRKTRED